MEEEQTTKKAYEFAKKVANKYSLGYNTVFIIAFDSFLYGQKSRDEEIEKLKEEIKSLKEQIETTGRMIERYTI